MPTATTGKGPCVTKHIGIAAASPEGSALCYRQIYRHASMLVTPDQHPTVSVHNIQLHKYIDAVRLDAWEEVGALLRLSCDALARAGAELCICPDNAIQHAQHLAEHNSPIPWVSMIEVVGEAIERDGRSTVGLIGTSAVTLASSYQTRLGMRGVKVVAPSTEHADAMDNIIFGELVYGRVRPESVSKFAEIINEYAQSGCEGIVLACSEAPLIVRGESSPLPLYDTTDLLAERAMLAAMDG